MSFAESFKKMLQIPEDQITRAGFDDKKDYADTIKLAIDGMKKYFNSVIDYTVNVHVATQMYDGEIQRYMILEADKNRNAAHNAAIAKCNLLNNICQKIGIDPIVEIDTTDRYAVADFVCEACMGLYLSSQTKSKYHSFDELLMDDKIPDEKKFITENLSIDDLIEKFSTGNLECAKSQPDRNVAER